MLKFLVDSSTGKHVFDFLLEKDFDVKYVSYIMPGNNDEDILKLAEKEKRILITNDKDFGKLVYKLKQPAYGIILLRLLDETKKNKIKIIKYVLENFSHKLEKKFIVAKERQIRIRDL